MAGSVYSHDKPNPLTARQHCSEVHLILNVFFVMCVYTRVSQCLVTVNMLLFQSNVYSKAARQVLMLHSQLVRIVNNSVSLFSLNFFKHSIFLTTDSLKDTFRHGYERCQKTKSCLAPDLFAEYQWKSWIRFFSLLKEGHLSSRNMYLSVYKNM